MCVCVCMHIYIYIIYNIYYIYIIYIIYISTFYVFMIFMIKWHGLVLSIKSNTKSELLNKCRDINKFLLKNDKR